MSRTAATAPAQAPSTQRILDEMAAEGVALPQIPAAQRIVGGEVQTGNGTRGPKKW